MRWLIFALGIVLLVVPIQASALIVSPNFFNATLPHNSTFSDHFRITPENVYSEVQITWSAPFNVSVPNTTMNLSTYYDLDFNITIPEFFLERIYQTYIFVAGENESEIVTVEIVVDSEDDFTTTEGINITAESGDTGFFIIPLTNTGNGIADVQIETSIAIGNLTTSLDSINLYPGIRFEIPFIYTLDEEIDPDTYLATIRLTKDNETTIIPVHIEVKDGQLPVIEDFGFTVF